jgi:hypothetical protein
MSNPLAYFSRRSDDEKLEIVKQFAELFSFPKLIMVKLLAKLDPILYKSGETGRWFFLSSSNSYQFLISLKSEMAKQESSKGLCYAQHVQQILFECNRVYEHIGFIRGKEVVSPGEADLYNECRGLLSQVYAKLLKVYDIIPDETAAEEIPKF